MQKLTAQNLSEAIAQQLGLSKKISDTFVRAFAEGPGLFICIGNIIERFCIQAVFREQ